MLLKLIRSIKCFVAVVGLFFTAGVANADIVADVGGIGFFKVTIDEVCYTEDELTKDIEWTVELIAGSAGGLFGDTMGGFQEFKYETVVMVNGVETLVIPGGTWSTDMGLSSAWYTAKISLKKLGILNLNTTGKYYLKAYTRNYYNGVNINHSQVYVSSEVEVEYIGPKMPKLDRLIIKGVDVFKGYTPTTDKENFLVTGSPVSVEAEVLNYDEEYFDLKSAKLIGTCKGGPATRNHEPAEAELCYSIQKTEHFAKGIILTHSLDEGDGFHGNYEWKVEAEFLCKIDGNTYSEESFKTNAPVFFHKYGTDESRQCGVPNWFVFWKKDGACPSLNDDSVRIKQELRYRAAYGDYSPDDGSIGLNPDVAAETHYDVTRILVHPENDPKKNDLRFEFSGPHIWGIYTTEEVVAHEKKHYSTKKEYDNFREVSFWDGINGNGQYYHHGTKSWFDKDQGKSPNEYWKADDILIVNENTCEAGKAEKPNCDYLYDIQEETENDYKKYKFSIYSLDTYGIGKQIGNKSISKGESEYAAYGDNEFLAMMAANKATEAVRAKKENDWAFPGEQTCVPIRTMEARWDLAQSNKVNGVNRNYGWYVRNVSDNKSMRSVAQDQTSRTSSAQTEFVTPKSSSAPPAITVNGMTKEIVYDEIGSSVSAVIYRFNLMVHGFNDLRLSGVLTDLNSNIVAYANTSVTSGNVVGELRFEGNDIYESSKDGPFMLESVKLVSFTGNDFSELATLSEFKVGILELNRKDLVRNDAYLLDVASEAVTTNGIEVAINTEVNVAGKYEIFATLGSTNGMPVAMCRKAMDCSVGTNCFTVVFAASDILKSGVDGPYNIDNLALYKDGVRIDSRLDYSILKKNYRAGAFDFEAGEEIDSDQFMSQFEDYTPPPELPPVKTYWVVFNANGGTTSETIREVKSGDEIGALPVAESGNDEFLGWYTELEGGTRISNATIITTNVLYHAQWKEVIDEVVFTSTAVNTKEGDSVVVTIIGGTEESASSVQLYGVYNTAAAADLDLAKTLVDGKPIKGFKFPYTLTWEKGEYANHTVTFFTKVDKAVEDQEFLTLQLANPTGTLLGKNDVCTVRINDINSYATLQDGITNPNIKVSTKGDGKWIVSEGSAFDDDGSDGLYHVQSPKLKQGESSTLSFSTVNGNGKFYFYVRIITDSEEKVPSVLNVYDGKKLLGTIDYTQGANIWVRRHITVSGGSSTLPNNFNFVFVQGSNPDARIEISDVYWVNDGTPPIYFVTAWEDYTNGGYVTGSGTYLKGQTAKIVAKPLPGWEFAGWDEVIYDEVTGEISSIEFFSEKSTVSFRPTKNSYFIANFSKIPYVRGLADPADGGKVSGSGLCAEGKKVTLKASANKNFTFKGWYASILGNSNFVNETNCVATTASLVIDRTSKPMANSKTSTTITDITAGVTYFAVFEGDPRVAVSVNPAPEAGKVTGVGRYAPGKKVTVKATANKGYVFNGWYLGERCITQAANYAFTMPEEDVALIAKFVTAEEDAASIALSVDALGGEISPEAIISVTNTCGVALKWSVVADAFSQPKVTVSGLPAGLKFTAKDIMKEGSKTDVEIPANTIYGAPTAESKLDAKTGLRKPSAVKFTVTTAGKSKRVYPVDMTVLPLPDWAVGTFNGGGDLGQISLTVAKTGKLSGKYLSDGLTWALAANSFDSIDDSGDVYRATLIGKSGKLVMTNDVGVACDAMGGFA